MADAQAPVLGVMVTGQYLFDAPGKPWDDRGGERRTPHDVNLRVGPTVVRVEYDSQDDAQAAVGAAIAGDTISVVVFPRIGGPRGASSQCFLVYGGQRGR